MNIQDFLKRYVNKKLDLYATKLELNDDSNQLQGILISISNGRGISTIITVPLTTDLDSLFEREVKQSSNE